MNKSPQFFVGLAILLIFGFRLFIIYLIILSIYNVVSSNKFFKGLEGSIQKFIQDLFISEAEVVKKKQSLFKLSNMQFKNYIKLFSVIAIIFIFLDGFVMIPAGRVGVILDRGRGVLENTLDTGLHLKIPFWQKVTILNTQLQSYTMSGTHSEGDQYGDDSIEALTKDGQKVQVDLTVQFRLGKDSAPVVYEEVGLDYVSKIVRPAARSIIRNVVTAYNSKELFNNESRIEAQGFMKEQMTENLKNNNLVLGDVLLRNVRFSAIYLQAIEEKQVAEQQIQKAEFEKEEAAIIKEKKIIEAEAEAESIKLKGDALRANPSVIQFNMVEKLSPNISWGVLPDGVMPLLDINDLKQ